MSGRCPGAVRGPRPHPCANYEAGRPPSRHRKLQVPRSPSSPSCLIPRRREPMVGCPPPPALRAARHNRPALRLVAGLLVVALSAALGWLGLRVVLPAGSPTPVYSLAALEAHL